MKFLKTSTSATITSLTIFIGSTPLFAQGTWIEVHRVKTDAGKKFDIGGVVHYIDMKSVVRKGNIAYYNWNIRLFNNKGRVNDSNLDEKPSGGRINCRDKTIWGNKNNGTWFPIKTDNKTNTLTFEMVCEKSINSFKFW